MNQRDQIALQIFLKRVPSEPLNNMNAKGFASKAEESYELADIFLAQKKKQAAPPVQLEGGGVE